jgi:hypothetical protein
MRKNSKIYIAQNYNKEWTYLFEHWVPVRRSKTDATFCQLLSPKYATAEQSWASSSSVHSRFIIEEFKLLWNRAKHWNGILFVANDTAISNQFRMPFSCTIIKRDLSSSKVHGPWLIKGSSQFNHLWLQTLEELVKYYIWESIHSYIKLFNVLH